MIKEIERLARAPRERYRRIYCVLLIEEIETHESFGRKLSSNAFFLRLHADEFLVESANRDLQISLIRSRHGLDGNQLAKSRRDKSGVRKDKKTSRREKTQRIGSRRIPKRISLLKEKNSLNPKKPPRLVH
jgi:hypothetical protein